MVFSKEEFIKNAPTGIKRQLGNHIDVLDGKEVVFKNGDQYGMIPQYFENGQKYYLYPVYKSWCIEKIEQLPGQVTIDEWLGA